MQTLEKMLAAAAAPSLLSSQLRALTPEQSRLARLAFDRRFLLWVDALLPEPGARLVQADAEVGVEVFVALRCAHGDLEVAADAQVWPALAMAARSDDPQHACDVVTILLAAPLAVLGGSLPALAVRAVRIGPAAGGLRLSTSSVELRLVSLDDGVAAHLGALMASGHPAATGHLRRLRLPARINLFSRDLSFDCLTGLACGDVVLGAQRPADGASLRCRISFGLGVTMQATADLDLATPTATLAGPLEHSQDPGAVEGPPPGAIGELTVPVAFELDTARVSLEELAAIGPGSVIDLQASAMDATVLLVCMGQVIGNGQLMVIGDRLGVRVTRMGADLQGRLWSRT